MAFARTQFELSIIHVGNTSKRAHLESVARQTGKELDEEDCPYTLSYLWAWWHELHCGARETGIDYTHILAWCTLTDITLSHFELSALMRIDQLFLTVIAEQHKHG